jgi:hypothetical protein
MLRKEQLNYKLRKIGVNNFIEYLLKKTYRKIEAFLPGIFSYDWLLRYTKNVEVPDIDRLIVFSVVKQHNIIATYLKKNVPIDLYLYSWDHPIKEVAFSCMFRKIYVWNQGLKEDLCFFHSIPDEKVKIVGSTQLAYIHKLRNLPRIDLGLKKFIYVILTTGREELILQELDFIDKLALHVKKSELHIDLVVRRYPNMPETLYQTVKSRIHNAGAIFDDTIYKGEMESREVKYHLMQTAEFLIHMGTTVGIEAVLVNKNVIFYTFQSDHYKSQQGLVRDLVMNRNHLHQHHLQKYFIGYKENKVAESVKQCITIIENFKTSKSDYSITHGIELISLKEIANNIIRS